jgi:hypothetical protein
MELSMIILFVVGDALFAAVIARSMFDPCPSEATDEAQHQTNIMEAVAQSYF